MISKPKHFGPEYALRFKDRSVADAYHLRVPYPVEVFGILSGLIVDKSPTVLDVGCGTGNIARRLVGVFKRVDAVDFSLPMIEKGRLLPEGDHPNLNWINGRVEEVPLSPPYALITAGASLHWMDWGVVMPRFRQVLTSRGYVAVVTADAIPPPWYESLSEIIRQFSTNRDYQTFDMIKGLEDRGLFQQHGEKETAPVSFMQALDDYIGAFHSMSSFSRESMGEELAIAFDTEVKQLISRFCKEGVVELQVVGKIVWGRPIDKESKI
jgi:SAM-dependent methyltransferase